MLFELVELDEPDEVELVRVVEVELVEVVLVVLGAEVVDVAEVVAELEEEDSDTEEPVVGDDEVSEDVVVEVEEEPEGPGASARYPVTPPITIITAIAKTKTPPVMPRFNVKVTRCVNLGI